MSDTVTGTKDRKMGRTSATDPASLRKGLLSGLAVAERRIDLAGVPTAILEGGDGPAVVLLHGPGEHAPKWRDTIEGLVNDHRVVAPDLPGHGASDPADGPLDAALLMSWLEVLVEECCEEPPTLVGHIVGGAIAARFAIDHGERIDRLVLVDSLGLTAFDPAPEFGQALQTFVKEPNQENHERLWQRCAYDLDRLRSRMGDRWPVLEAYNLDRARTPEQQAAMGSVMENFGFPPIPGEELASISVPTVLIWGREDLATDVGIAEEASERYGWPLHVIEDAADDPPLERPEEFVRVFRTATGNTPNRRFE